MYSYIWPMYYILTYINKVGTPRLNITKITDYFKMQKIIVIHIYDICIVL
jgi:hypothetical protein